MQPGSDPRWARAFAHPTTVYVRPDGSLGEVQLHRTYLLPDGSLTPHSAMLRTNTRYVRRHLPASQGPFRPRGVRGAWVQLSADGTKGIRHAHGVPSLVVQVLDVQRRNGKLMALVRSPQQTLEENPKETEHRRVSTRVASRTVSPPASTLCRVFPRAQACAPRVTMRRNPEPATELAEERRRVQPPGVLTRIGAAIDKVVRGTADLVVGQRGVEVVAR